MGTKTLANKALYIVLSIVLAFGLWLYVTSQDGNETNKAIRNIPVSFAGVETLEGRGLMIVGTVPTASVTVRAAPVVLAKLDDSSITLTVDVSRITEPAEYTLAYNASLPSDVNANQVEFVRGETGNVTFTVARYTQREVEIRGRFAGTAAEGYLAGDSDDFLFSPTTVTVSGQAELVNQVAYIRVTVDGTELTETVNGEYPFELIGVDGGVLEDLNVTCSVESVYTTFPILDTAEIPLTVTLVAGGGVTESQVRCQLSTSSITVAGSAAAVSAIREAGAISLTTLNLANVRDGDTFTCSVPLTDELTNLSGITEVTVTISLDQSLETRQFDITQINYTGLADGWEATLVTQMLPVEVRGDKDLMEGLKEENIRVVADLSGINLAAGQYTVPVTIYVDSVGTAEQIGVVGTDYKVVVAISKS